MKGVTCSIDWSSFPAPKPDEMPDEQKSLSKHFLNKMVFVLSSINKYLIMVLPAISKDLVIFFPDLYFIGNIF